MFDVGFSELVLFAVVALVVLGPEKLPHAARIAGAWVARIRRTISTVQTEIEREVAAQEVRQKLEKEFRAMGGETFVRGIEAERRDLQATLDEAGAALRDPAAPAPLNLDLSGMQVPGVSLPADATTAAPAPAAAVAQQPAAPLPFSASAVDAPAAPVLPDAATPPDQVRLDGEAAYREWLAAQRRENRIAPPAPGAGKDTPA